MEICKLLNIHDIIMLLLNDYNNVINQNGVDLSGGERQRVYIAWVILSKSSVYLFDEITSAIDKKIVLKFLI